MQPHAAPEAYLPPSHLSSDGEECLDDPMCFELGFRRGFLTRILIGLLLMYAAFTVVLFCALSIMGIAEGSKINASISFLTHYVLFKLCFFVAGFCIDLGVAVSVLLLRKILLSVRKPGSWPYTFPLCVCVCCSLMAVFGTPFVISAAVKRQILPWYTGLTPQSFRRCGTRVDPAQATLFSADMYAIQFARVQNRTLNLQEFLPFDKAKYLAIQEDRALCSQGFQGNQDIYGIGSRSGLYIQWLTAILVNNLLPQSRNDFRKIYLSFSFALCAIVLLLTFSSRCTFAVEIQIIYWAYWGGFFCVFASSPSYARLGLRRGRIGLDWITGTTYLLNAAMLYHSVFFWYYGYDQWFARLPCGTYHFVLAPVLDPSNTFWLLRDILVAMLGPFTFVMILLIPTVGVVFASEIKESMQSSSVYQLLLECLGYTEVHGTGECTITGAAGRPTASRTAQRLSGLARRIRAPYRVLRMMLSLPQSSQGGIRLIEAIDVEQRRNYRIACGLLGLASYALSISAIETTLRWNKVVDINSMASSGQYMVLLSGVATLATYLWQILKREAVWPALSNLSVFAVLTGFQIRRRRNREPSGAEQDIELELLPHTLSGAIRYALGQVDAASLPLSSSGPEERPTARATPSDFPNP